MKTLRLTEQQLEAIKKRTGSYTTPASTRSLERGAKQFAKALKSLADHDAGKSAEQPDRYPLMLRDQIVQAGLPEPFREFVWHPTRNFRADLCWPSKKFIVEVDGAVHRMKDKFARDIERHNLLIQAGYLYIRVTPAMVKSGEALQLVKEFIDAP